jgi:hypothetical protein
MLACFDKIQIGNLVRIYPGRDGLRKISDVKDELDGVFFDLPVGYASRTTNGTLPYIQITSTIPHPSFQQSIFALKEEYYKVIYYHKHYLIHKIFKNKNCPITSER